MRYVYLVGLFDILGFEKKLASIGLAEMLACYEVLIDAVDYRKEQEQRVFVDMDFKESAYWRAEGDVGIFSKTHGAYASDSILLWANRTWPEARDKSPEDIERLSKDPAKGWAFHPTPCDNFLDVCNDLMCCGLETGLPLRGAISMGEAVLDGNKNIFLGHPIIEAARLERGQRFIGASLCKSFVNQTIPKRYLQQFDMHLKDGYAEQYGGFVLDWPRHWRKTRSGDLSQIIKEMNNDAQFSAYYENTLDLIAHSDKFAAQFESKEEISIRSVYDEFSFSNEKLTVPARAIRRVPIMGKKK
jgi:hypothetical protein